ncbi:MAG: hypothetical protein JST92_05265, partial [Deltaproteobacteria bacterium]|nr:hypothetical protein [Deltaproteobacteria bacterium]
TLTPTPTPTPTRTPSPPDAPLPDQTACVDAWLSAHALNTYGDKPDTMYPGGTPLFNERTGARTDRLTYLFGKNAELKAACAKK